MQIDRVAVGAGDNEPLDLRLSLAAGDEIAATGDSPILERQPRVYMVLDLNRLSGFDLAGAQVEGSKPAKAGLVSEDTSDDTAFGFDVGVGGYFGRFGGWNVYGTLSFGLIGDTSASTRVVDTTGPNLFLVGGNGSMGEEFREIDGEVLSVKVQILRAMTENFRAGPVLGVSHYNLDIDKTAAIFRHGVEGDRRTESESETDTVPFVGLAAEMPLGAIDGMLGLNVTVRDIEGETSTRAALTYVQPIGAFPGP